MRFRRLETRLVVSYLLLAAVPLLVLSLFAAVVTRGGLQRIASPIIGESFDRSAALSRELRDRLEFDARVLLGALPREIPSEAGEPGIAALLEEAEFHFAAWGSPAGQARIVAVAAADSAPGWPDVDDWRELSQGERPPTRSGAFLRFFEAGDDGGTPARAVGLRLDPAIADAFDSASRLYPSAQQLSSRFAGVLRAALLAGLAATFLITALTAYLLARHTARRVSRPVTELARSADRLAAGDLAHRARVRADGEVGDLVTSFNRMGERLQRSQRRLVRAERLAAWRDVARRAAHEIKNPLTPIRLALHRLRRRIPDDADARGCLDSIDEEIENLTRLAGNFSEFAEFGTPVFAETDLARVAAGVVELFGGTAENVAMRYEGPETLPLVADRDLLRRAITNLVKNAIEALGDRHGNVVVTVSSDEERAVISVTDDGPGVPASIRETLFRPGISGRAGGSGLGLAMVQGIAEFHRGALKWEECEPGTRFVIDVPLAQPETP